MADLPVVYWAALRESMYVFFTPLLSMDGTSEYHAILCTLNKHLPGTGMDRERVRFSNPIGLPARGTIMVVVAGIPDVCDCIRLRKHCPRLFPRHTCDVLGCLFDILDDAGDCPVLEYRDPNERCPCDWSSSEFSLLLQITSGYMEKLADFILAGEALDGFSTSRD